MVYTFEVDNTYNRMLVRAEIVLNDGSVKASNVYINLEQDLDNYDKHMIYVDRDSPFDNNIDYVVISYTIGIEYGSLIHLKPIKVNGIYHMYSGVSIDDTDNGGNGHLLTGGITEFGVSTRDINNPIFLDYYLNYPEIAKCINTYKISIRIVQSFTPWGVIPMLYICGLPGGLQAFTIFGNRLLQIVNVLDVYDISETELIITIDDEKDVAAAAELGIRMFDEWAYDYSFFIEPIRKYFYN